MRKRCHIFFTSYIFIFFVFFASEAVADSTNLSNIKKTYMDIKTLEAQFHQTLFISSLKKERQFEGTFFYKRGIGFLWQYEKPKKRFFLYDGKFIWQGDEEKPFIYKKRVDKNKTEGTFLDLVNDLSKIDELFKYKDSKTIGDLVVMELIPVKEGQIISTKLFIDRQYMIKKIELYEFTGNVNILTFTLKKMNQPISDSKFTFKPDKDREIIETN